jgi:hypothetical protein
VPAICAAVALSVSDVYVVCGAGAPRRCQVRARWRSTACRWPATGRRTLGRRSTTVEVGRTVAPPSSATARGVETSRVATSKETSTCMHQRVRAKLHMHHSPWLPGSFFGGGGGCMALAPHLRMVVWPPKFQPYLPKKYGGTVNPAEFLQIYSTSILAAGGNEAIMANYFPVALMGTARS